MHDDAVESSCHCGAIRIQIAKAPETVTDCNCSICRRLGALWAYYNPAQVRLATPDAAIGAYAWGERLLAFHHCQVCGCTTHWSPLTDVGRMGVNARLFPPDILAAARVRHLDGADTWTFLNEED
jgi:hypothetical protein